MGTRWRRLTPLAGSPGHTRRSAHWYRHAAGDAVAAGDDRAALPPFALDLLFTFNIALAIIVLLAACVRARPLEFAVFPTVLLIATLLRLGLNVASTRVVLLNGTRVRALPAT
jgi:hypothetical protein